MRELTFSPSADQDIDSILDWSIEHFGEAASSRYAILIYHCCELIRADPLGQSTHVSETTDFRLIHLKSGSRSAPPAARVKHPRHFILFRVVSESTIEISRVLHDRMNMGDHLPGAAPTGE
ncbi:MAG TPA: type II toxin-antitoxin system RelE/ParE family toxin [Caulifigura sp.]|jgi:toxin ParE1/3/4|nr:type II toxin-antitoxin system RelE/ParE family toxin [Caulifigura sp.]